MTGIGGPDIGGPDTGAPDTGDPIVGGGGSGRRGWRAQRVVAVVVGLAVVALVGVLATRQTAVERDAASPLLGRDAPLFSGESVLDGTRFSLAEQRGRWVVLNVFASWCVPCVREHPDLVRFHERNVKAGSDVVLVSAVFDDARSDVRRFFAERGGSWPVIQDSKLLVDYAITGVPETMLISPAGQVLWKQARQVSLDDLEGALATGRRLYASAGGGTSVPAGAPASDGGPGDTAEPSS